MRSQAGPEPVKAAGHESRIGGGSTVTHDARRARTGLPTTLVRLGVGVHRRVCQACRMKPVAARLLEAGVSAIPYRVVTNVS